MKPSKSQHLPLGGSNSISNKKLQSHHTSSLGTLLVPSDKNVKASAKTLSPDIGSINRPLAASNSTERRRQRLLIQVTPSTPIQTPPPARTDQSAASLLLSSSSSSSKNNIKDAPASVQLGETIKSPADNNAPNIIHRSLSASDLRTTLTAQKSPVISPVSSNGCSFVDYDIRSTAELLAQVPSKQIARQITVRDADLFKSIVAEHLESCSWQGPDKYVKSPSVASMIQHFNETTMWISACVLDAEGLQERHGRLAYWIDVCRRLSAMNNFNGAKCVLSGLEYGPVYRLESTWSVSVTLYFKSYNNRITQLLSRQERQTFEGLREELSPLDNASKYRKRLKKSNAPLLPFLGYHLGDLVYLKEMIRQDVGRGDLEQVKQREQQFLKLIQDLLAMQQKCTYNYQPMPSIQQLIQQQNYYKPQLKNQMEDRNYARSYQLEPKHNPQTLLLLSASSSPTSRSATAPVTVNSASPTSTTNTNDSSDTAQRTDSSSSSNYASTPPSPLLQQSGSAKRHRLFPKYHSFTVSAATASNVLKQTSPPLASPLQSPPQHEQQLQHLKDNARSSARSSLNSIFAAIHKRWGSMHSTHSNDMTIVPISDDSIVNSSNSEDYTNSPIGNSNGETVIVTNSESIKESADETANYSSMSIGRRGLFNRGRSKTVGIVPPK